MSDASPTNTPQYDALTAEEQAAVDDAISHRLGESANWHAATEGDYDKLKEKIASDPELLAYNVRIYTNQPHKPLTK